jgi:hypothetical protein
MRNIALLATIFLGLSACDRTQSADSKDTKVVDEQQAVYAQSQPIPVFKWSQDRDNLIQIYRQKATESRNTYTVVRSYGTGEIMWHCASVGFPLPADTQLTNPVKLDSRWVTNGVNHYIDGQVEQAEPNGLYTSKNTDGTYVLCVDDQGVISPQYTEEKVEAFTRPVKIVEGRVEFQSGAPSMVVKPKKK